MTTNPSLWTTVWTWFRPTPTPPLHQALARLQARMDSLEQIVLVQTIQAHQPVETLAAQPILDDRPMDDIPDAHLGAY